MLASILVPRSRSRARQLTRWWWLLALWLPCWVANPTLARAAEPARERVTIRIVSSNDRALLERVRGQLSDLALELVVIEPGPAASGVSKPADVFAHVWFSRRDPAVDSVTVHVTTAGDPERRLERALGTGSHTPSGELSSATLEAAALLVREALRHFAATEAAPQAAAAPRAPETQQRPPRDPTASSTAGTAPLHFTSQLLWQAVLDGADLFERTGPGLRLGVKYAALEVAAFASTSLAGTERDRYGVIRLRRHAAGVRLGHEWRLSQAIAVDLGLLLGMAWYARSTVRLAAPVSSAGDRVSQSLLVGPELALGWAPGHRAFELSFIGGLGLLPSAPHIGYRIDGEFDSSFVVWRLQPSFGIGAKFHSDRWP